LSYTGGYILEELGGLMDLHALWEVVLEVIIVNVLVHSEALGRNNCHPCMPEAWSILNHNAVRMLDSFHLELRIIPIYLLRMFHTLPNGADGSEG
jgi:hypothetical protein